MAQLRNQQPTLLTLPLQALLLASQGLPGQCWTFHAFCLSLGLVAELRCPERLPWQAYVHAGVVPRSY